MSSYKRIINYLLLSFVFVGCSTLQDVHIPDNKKDIKNYNIEYKTFDNENKFIIFALEYDKQGRKNEARHLYKELYDRTLKEEYLFEYSKLSFALKKYDDVVDIVEFNEERIILNKDKIKRIYILSLLQNNDYERAEKSAQELLKTDTSDINYDLLGNVYIQKSEYKKAKDIYFDTYKKVSTPRSLLNLVNVMYLYLDEKKEAINFLESYININGCNDVLCSKLLSFYQEQKDIDGTISVLKKTYSSFEKKGSAYSLDKVYKLLIYYLEKKDIREAIRFLEETKANDEKLLSLYRSSIQYDKAYELAKKLYDDTSNIDFLAQIAIIEFERAKDKRKVLKSVIEKFENVLTVLDNHVYQNYLGYLLIDYDIDIKKGMEYVNKALEKAPHNLAYIDSLAWGQYKLNDCKNAYINMKKVIDSTGLEDDEIKMHWEKIKECNK